MEKKFQGVKYTCIEDIKKELGYLNQHENSITNTIKEVGFVYVDDNYNINCVDCTGCFQCVFCGNCTLCINCIACDDCNNCKFLEFENNLNNINMYM